jgi:alkylation response protein AidB-like acyl-CoA dehydrogenase
MLTCLTEDNHVSAFAQVMPASRQPAQDVLAKVRAIGPSIAARSAEFEEKRRIPPDVIEQLKAAQVFRMATPRVYGGLQLDYPAILDVLRELAFIDGAVGWVAMLGVGHAPHLALLPRKTLDTCYAKPDVILGGCAAPFGTGIVVPGGYRVSGRWPFASGCQSATWLFAGFTAMRDGKSVISENGKPVIRHAVLPAGAWTIDDTWHAAGLKGTGSNHIRLDDVFVPEFNTFAYTDAPSINGRLYSSPLHMIPLLHCAPALGIAEAALRDLVALAMSGKRQLLAPDAMQDSPLFHMELGRLEADVKAVRATSTAQANALWHEALAGDMVPSNSKMLAACFQTATWVTNACVRVVDECYRLGGGSALYASSPLQRRLRDIHTASQHAAVQPASYQRCGALLLGHKVTNPVID